MDDKNTLKDEIFSLSEKIEVLTWWLAKLVEVLQAKAE